MGDHAAGLAVRPTPEQFDAAMAYAEEHGVGLERALLLHQLDAIHSVQTSQNAERWNHLLRVCAEQYQQIVVTFTDALDSLANSSAWPVIVEFAEAEAKRERRAANRARWQARRRSR